MEINLKIFHNTNSIMTMTAILSILDFAATLMSKTSRQPKLLSLLTLPSSSIPNPYKALHSLLQLEKSRGLRSSPWILFFILTSPSDRITNSSLIFFFNSYIASWCLISCPSCAIAAADINGVILVFVFCFFFGVFFAFAQFFFVFFFTCLSFTIFFPSCWWVSCSHGCQQE